MPSVPRLVVLLALAASCVITGCAVGFPKETTGVTPTGATLNAQVFTTFGGPVTYWFRYGLTSAYGSETPHRTISMGEGTSQSVSEPLTGLIAGREYHWQVCAQDEEEEPARVNCSGDETFRTFVLTAVSCGQTITLSVRITNDLQDCPGNGLAVGANNITIDLNGHTIDGELSTSGTGIRNEGFDGVWIEDGRVQEFGASGVFLENAADNRVGGLTMQSLITQGIDVDGDSTGTVIADNTANATGIALRIRDSVSGVLVKGNTVSGIGLTGSDKQGPLFVLGNDNRIEGNTATLIHVDGVGRGVGRASLIVVGDGNEIVGNITNDSPTTGLLVDAQASDTLLSGNLAANNGHEFVPLDGIVIESASTSIGDNTANLNGNLGINAVAGVTDLGGNRAEGNGNPLECQNVVCE